MVSGHARLSTRAPEVHFCLQNRPPSDGVTYYDEFTYSQDPPHPTPRAYPYVSRISNAYHECRLHHVTSPSHLTTASAANAGKTCVQSKNLAMWRLLLESMRYMPSLLEMATNKSCENTTH